jgi:UbiD family decarboxylase
MTTPAYSFRDALTFLSQNDQMLTIQKPVDPKYEIAGILKALDGGPAILFDAVNGYTNMRAAGNILATRENVQSLFGLRDNKETLEWGRTALLNPTPPIVVDKAPCQEIVVDSDIDIIRTLPVITHSHRDVGPIIGSGKYLIAGDYFNGGTEISFKRTQPLGKDWCSVMAVPGSHIRTILERNKGAKIPVTMNMGTPPAVLIVAGTGVISLLMPFGGDELGVAGTLQGRPIEICKAKTVDAYAIAQSEIVLEGYIHATRDVWESKEAEKVGESRVTPFFPEWPKYLGRARKVFKFEVTAITHRKDRPIFYTILADSFEADIFTVLLRESYLYHIAECTCPGLVQDIFQLYPAFLTTRIQVKKRGRFDEGWSRNLIQQTFASFPGTRFVFVADEDIDIRNAEEVIWAISTRVDFEKDIILSAGGKGIGMMPIEILDKEKGKLLKEGKTTRGIGIDATIPLETREHFERAKYPSSQIDLTKWLSKDAIKRVQAAQSDYAKVLAKIGG